jgi:hypothetical protein
MICLRFGNDDTWFLVMRFGRASEVLGVCFGNNYKTDWVWSLVESSSYFLDTHESVLSLPLTLGLLRSHLTKSPACR